MRINKKKFATRMFILISIIGILVYVRHLSVNDESREELFNYWEGVISSLKNTDSYLVAEKLYSVDYDKNVKNTVVGRNNGAIVLNTNSISEYNIDANASWKYEINMVNPMIETCENWMAVAEENGVNLTVFDLTQEIYSTQIEGFIQKVYINKAGYVGVIYEKTGYKNAFAYINPKGEILYTKYFAKTTLVDVDIRDDGKVISMIEADTDGVVVNFAITFLDDKGNTLYSAMKKNTLLVETTFIDDKVVLISDSDIVVIDKEYNENALENFEGQEILGLCVKDGKIVKFYRDSNELFADKTKIEIKNVSGKVIGSGEFEGNIQSLKVRNNILAIVLTDRIDFFTSKGNYCTSIFTSGEFTDIALFKNGNYACVQTTEGITIYKVK